MGCTAEPASTTTRSRRGLIELGHEVALIPTYTPLKTDENNVAIDSVFYGAVNVYLEQKSAFFRRAPEFLHRWLNRRWLLEKAGQMSGSTDASELGDLTLSVLLGEEGRQRRELEELVDWLESYRPDVVHLTNCMFLGFARRIRERLGVAITCGLTGEDIFLDALKEPYGTRVHDELKRRARDADLLVAGTRYYADHMREYLAVEADRVEVVPLGIKLDDFPTEWSEPEPSDEVVIGYLARICPAKGLHQLIDAFRSVGERLGRDRVRLRIAGYLGSGDREYWRELESAIESAGLADRVDFVGEVDRQGKIDFLRSLDLFSVPTVYAESKGLFVLEAMAAGVPIVQPAHGSFPEIVEATGGGVLYPPDRPEALAKALVDLIGDRERREEIGRRGHRATHEHYGDEEMARRTLGLFERALARAGAPAAATVDSRG